jgi:hypothetical protein
MTDTAATQPAPAERSARLAAAYRVLAGDDSGERACAAIPAAACTDVPRNYLLNVANGAATKLAEQLASPGLVLPWLLAGIGAPAAAAGLLVPIRQAGALLPQLAVAGRIRALAQRKWVWVGAGLFQALMLTLIGAGALLLPAELAGALLLVAFAVFSLASGAGSVAYQDVMGKTVPAGRRGRLLSNRAVVGGALTLLTAGALGALSAGAAPSSEAAVQVAVPLLALAALLWVLGAGAFAAIREEPGATEGGRSMLRELGAGMALLRGVPGFRRFLAARGLLLAVELATPFLTLHAGALYGTATPLLGTYVLALGAASLVASPFWGRWADVSSRLVMAAAGAIGAGAGALALGLAFLPASWGLGGAPWLYAGAFLLIGVAEAGLRLGRKTYLVDAAPAEARPLYTAFANTATGLLALSGGLLGLLADLTVPAAAVGAVTVLAAAGAWLCWRLPEARDLVAGAAPSGG